MQEQQSQHSIKSQKNYLVTFATPLLTLITQIRHTSEHHHVVKFRVQIIEEIKNFEQKLTNVSYPIRLVIAARYCLCTAIDEAVLSRPWGTQSIWIQQSLLSLFHQETWGGERFYILLEEMAKDPRQNIDFLEFAYVLLSLGFEGKFFENQLTIREEIRNRVFYRIRYSKEKPDKTLSRYVLDKILIIDQTKQIKTIKKTGVITAVVIIIVSLFYNVILYKKAEPFMKALDAIGNVSAVTTFSQVIQRPVIERGIN